MANKFDHRGYAQQELNQRQYLSKYQALLSKERALGQVINLRHLTLGGLLYLSHLNHNVRRQHLIRQILCL